MAAIRNIWISMVALDALAAIAGAIGGGHIKAHASVAEARVPSPILALVAEFDSIRAGQLLDRPLEHNPLVQTFIRVSSRIDAYLQQYIKLSLHLFASLKAHLTFLEQHLRHLKRARSKHEPRLLEAHQVEALFLVAAFSETEGERHSDVSALCRAAV